MGKTKIAGFLFYMLWYRSEIGIHDYIQFFDVLPMDWYDIIPEVIHGC